MNAPQSSNWKLRGPGELRDHFGGPLLLPGDEGYEAARRVWNGAVDRRPAIVARCLNAADVRAAVQFGREQGLLIAVRGGGHNVAGTAVCDGGIVVDCSLMKTIEIDASAQIVSVAPGVLWGEVDAATQAHGLAVPGGIVTHTGVAGLTLGGGIGWLMRRFGLTCDSLAGADVVGADGRPMRAGPEHDPDLLWALRGGGGNFGIVTSFRFRLHEVGPVVLAGILLHPAERAVEVLRFYRDFAARAPLALTTIITVRRAAPLPLIPPELHGRPIISVGVCYAGDVEEGARVLAPLRRFGPPLLDLIQPTPYTAHQSFVDPTVPHAWHYYWRSHFLKSLSDEVVDTIAAFAWEAASPKSFSVMFQMGGTVADVPEGATAFGGRRAAFAVNINAVWAPTEDGQQDIVWTKAFWAALRPVAMDASYVNFLNDEGAEHVRAAYGYAVYARLARLKRRYDPDNAFRLNQNIPPA